MTSSPRKAAFLAAVELRLLLRRKVTAFSVLVVPAGLCALTWFTERDVPSGRWGPLLGQRFLMLMLLSVFLVSITVFTARRQSLVLKRLRTSELGDVGILAGVTAPIVVVGLVQVLGYFAFAVAVAAPPPDQLVVVAVAVLLGVASTVAAGLATAALSRSVEATQVTSVPLLAGAFAGLFMGSSSQPTVAAIGSVMPLAGPVNLLVDGWSGSHGGPTVGGLPAVVTSLGSTALWAVVFGLVIHRFFSWEPRG